MIVYNLTFSVDVEIVDKWLTWMRENYLPTVLNEGFITDCKILKVLTHEDEQTMSFAVQHYADSLHNVEKFLTQKGMDWPFGDRAVGYPTLLQEV